MGGFNVAIVKGMNAGNDEELRMVKISSLEGLFNVQELQLNRGIETSSVLGRGDTTSLVMEKTVDGVVIACMRAKVAPCL